MSRGGAQHSKDLQAMADELADRRLQLAINDMQIRLDCHGRAVASTTSFQKYSDGYEESLPVSIDVQMEYARELYEWATEQLRESV